MVNNGNEFSQFQKMIIKNETNQVNPQKNNNYNNVPNNIQISHANNNAFVRANNTSQIMETSGFLDHINSSVEHIIELKELLIGKIRKYPIILNIKNQKKVLILDLDETILKNVTFQEKNVYSANAIESPSGMKIIFRPFLNYFLTQVSPLYNIVIFTSAEQTYADEIVNMIDPEKKYFLKRFYRQHCVKIGDHLIKNLDCFSNIPKESIIAFDDNISFFVNNLDNILPSIPYNGSSQDNFLKVATEYLLACSRNKSIIEFNIQNLNLSKLLSKDLA